jgi:formamidopyrimidine-DNA glycosylase
MMEAGDVVIVHLGMSGRFSVQGRQVGSFVHEVVAEGQGTGKHDHVVFETDEGTLLVYTDHRRFGLMTLSTESGLDAHPLFAGLGPEPLTPKFGATYLLTAISGKRMPIKPALLDQRIVAGLGNIYVCEALFDSHISPLRPASSLSRDECVALVSSIKSVLKAAIKAGGSTLRDFRHADGELGYFQHSFSVYGREGEKCISPGCTGTVERTLQSGRSTFHCPVCQR